MPLPGQQVAIAAADGATAAIAIDQELLVADLPTGTATSDTDDHTE